MGITVSGLEHVRARIDAHVAKMKVDAQDAVEQAVENTYDESQADCPYDHSKKPEEPHLRNSARKEIGKLVGTVSYGNGEVDYPWHVELGTIKFHARPYLGPAYKRNAPKFKARCQQIARGE